MTPIDVFLRGDATRLIEGLTANDVQVLTSRPAGEPAIVPRIRVPEGTGDRALLDFVNLIELAIAKTLNKAGVNVPTIARHLRAVRGPKGLERVLTEPQLASVVIVPVTGEARVLSLPQFKQILDEGKAPALIALSLTDLVHDLRAAIATGKGRVVVKAAQMTVKPELRKPQ